MKFRYLARLLHVSRHFLTSLIRISSFQSRILILMVNLQIFQIGKRFPVEPNSFSLRTSFFFISFSGFLLMCLYRAMLGASLAIKVHRYSHNIISQYAEWCFEWNRKTHLQDLKGQKSMLQGFQIYFFMNSWRLDWRE